MIGNRHLIKFLLLTSLLSGASAAVAKDAARQSASQVGVGAQGGKLLEQQGQGAPGA